MNPPCTLYIVRHGETERNIQEVMSGQQETALTQNGIEQAKKLGREFKDIIFDAIYASDLTRAQITASFIKGARKDAIQIEKNLRERFYGKFEGQPQSTYFEALEKELLKMSGPTEAARWNIKLVPEMESRAEVADRFSKAIKTIAKNHRDKKILVVSHGGCISSFLVYLGQYKSEQLPFGAVSNCGYLKILCDGKNFKVLEIKGVKTVA